MKNKPKLESLKQLENKTLTKKEQKQVKGGVIVVDIIAP